MFHVVRVQCTEGARWVAKLNVYTSVTHMSYWGPAAESDRPVLFIYLFI